MVSVILAAGYATRLYPLTRNFPKPLLSVGSSTIIDRLLSDLDNIPEIEKHVIVTNHIFYNHFTAWKNSTSYKKEIIILDDGSDSNENRLGAVNDLVYVINKLDLKSNLLVLAGDNVVDFSFSGFVDYSLMKNACCICYHYENSIEALQKTGVLEKESNNKVLAMHEKPQTPPTNFAVPPFYIYNRSILELIKKAIEDGCDADAPGNLISWLCKKTDIYAWEMPGNRYDVGDINAYTKVNEIFKNT